VGIFRNLRVTEEAAVGISDDPKVIEGAVGEPSKESEVLAEAALGIS
jgi:hypothetical protein